MPQPTRATPQPTLPTLRPVGPVRSVIRPAGEVPEGTFVHKRWPVDADLAHSVEHLWWVSWDLPEGRSHRQETLPFPSVHVVSQTSIRQGAIRIVGIPEHRFSRVLRGRHRVFGIKFRPGGFRGVWGRPLTTLTGREFALTDVVPNVALVNAYQRALADADDTRDAPAAEAMRLQAAHVLLRAIVPPPPADLETLQRMVDDAANHRYIRRVADLVARHGVHTRGLQRWFSDVVGVSPKWVIQRYRMHEALALLDAQQGAPPRDGVSTVALDLGYADAAHFSRDFRAWVGMSPSQYLRGRRGPHSSGQSV